MEKFDATEYKKKYNKENYSLFQVRLKKDFFEEMESIRKESVSKKTGKSMSKAEFLKLLIENYKRDRWYLED